jgi:RNA polymerase subunit RPABC4/transcription elongation factor Spt4
MRYCPYCAESISEDAKVCPNCKKSLEFDILKEMYISQDSSNINKQVKRKLWYKEHSHIIFPIITTIIGFVAGAILLYSFAQVQFAGQRSEYKDKIAQLEKTISNKESAASTAESEYESRLKAKDYVIGILAEMNDIYSRLIYFTSRLSNASTITPNSTEDADFYTRNTKYLINLFNAEQEKLKDTEFQSDKTYNLETVPKLLEQ